MGHWTFMYAFDVFPHRKKKMEKSWVPFHHLRTSLSSRVSVPDRSMRSPSTLWRTTRGDPRRPEESPPVSLNWWSKTSCICIPVEILLTQRLWNIFEKVSSIYRGHGCQSMSHLIWPLFTFTAQVYKIRSGRRIIRWLHKIIKTHPLLELSGKILGLCVFFFTLLTMLKEVQQMWPHSRKQKHTIKFKERKEAGIRKSLLTLYSSSQHLFITSQDCKIN